MHARNYPRLHTWRVAELALLKDLRVSSQLHAGSTSSSGGASNARAAAAALQQAEQLAQQLLLQWRAAAAVHQRHTTRGEVLQVNQHGLT
jgi:hypothetical protein